MKIDRGSGSVQSLRFLILGQHVRVQCCDTELRYGLIANFGAMAIANDNTPPDLDYGISNGTTSKAFTLVRDGQTAYRGTDHGDLLFRLEKDITVELQKRRSDLFSCIPQRSTGEAGLAFWRRNREVESRPRHGDYSITSSTISVTS